MYPKEKKTTICNCDKASVSWRYTFLYLHCINTTFFFGCSTKRFKLTVNRICVNYFFWPLFFFWLVVTHLLFIKLHFKLVAFPCIASYLHDTWLYSLETRWNFWWNNDGGWKENGRLWIKFKFYLFSNIPVKCLTHRSI